MRALCRVNRSQPLVMDYDGLLDDYVSAIDVRLIFRRLASEATLESNGK
jgi:hypothetical protein